MVTLLVTNALIVAKLTMLAIVVLPPGPVRHLQLAAWHALAAPERSGGRPIVLRWNERLARLPAAVLGGDRA